MSTEATKVVGGAGAAGDTMDVEGAPTNVVGGTATNVAVAAEATAPMDDGNAEAAEDAAIVAKLESTTRDIVQELLTHRDSEATAAATSSGSTGNTGNDSNRRDESQDAAATLYADEDDEDDDEEEGGDETGEEALAKGLIDLHNTRKDTNTATEEEEDSSKDEGGAKDDMEVVKEDEGNVTATQQSTESKNATASTTATAEIASYSTRGRAQVENALDRLAAVGDLLAIGQQQPKKPAALLPPHHHHLHRETALPPSSTTRMRESFLSDSLTEEERRTRTRYLPDVEGMHALRKQEVKSDLALARSILGASGATERLVKTSKRSRQADDDPSNSSGTNMDVESSTQSGEDTILSEEDRASQSSSRSIDIGTTVLNLPSPAFVAPPESGSTNNSNKRSTPREVEAVAAFNPPRPPESIGAKKKHRMIRWERRPADIEADLSSYHKTVQRTREELKNAKDECERITTVDNQLRRHFLMHIKCMNDELMRLGEEIAAVQQECVDQADLPATSRTRTRGSIKGNTTAMRDVIQMLRAKGKDIEARGLTLPAVAVSSTDSAVSLNVSGVGGVTAASFTDWDRSTVFQPNAMAQGWIVPGDRVKTPYGEGLVVSMVGPGELNLQKHEVAPKKGAIVESQNDDSMELDTPEDLQDTSGLHAPGKRKASKGHKTKGVQEKNVSLANALAPRVCVRLPFGSAFFDLESVVSLEDPSVYADAQMAKRWTGIAETAKMQGASLDVSAMAQGLVGKADSNENARDLEKSQNAMVDAMIRRLVPFGASLLPTAIGRGTLLHKASLVDLDEAVSKAYFTGQGVLGMRNNHGIPGDVRKLEDTRQEHLILQAKVLQLRNQLYRQRRIRLLNEKTHLSSQERATKVESLVAEMRTDLKSLKSRLDVEIQALGINEDQAESILKAYYMSLDSQHSGEASPPKRHRRLSRADGEGDGEGDTEDGRESRTSAGTTDQQMLAETEESTMGTKL